MQRAEHCEELARETADFVKRELFLDLARQWRDLASDAELRDRKRVMSAVTSIPDILPKLLVSRAADSPGRHFSLIGTRYLSFLFTRGDAPTYCDHRHTQTFAVHQAMSALPLRADMCGALGGVR